jgi:hypothetical protein
MNKVTTACGHCKSTVFAGIIRGVWAISSVVVLAAGSSAGAQTIKIVTGTYGQNCGAPRGNATDDLAAHCDNRDECWYRIDKTAIGDPAVGCQKDFFAEWRCSDTEYHAAAISPEAGAGSTLVLSCIRQTGSGK